MVMMATIAIWVRTMMVAPSATARGEPTMGSIESTSAFSGADAAVTWRSWAICRAVMSGSGRRNTNRRTPAMP
jgi:hypothetical protein